ncbi:hypothetical protein NXS19_000023 [Fusarium pseudograminearum]|nr:hypothetical protein NXS19_000023 [Fusarium pseudograminearum]
MDVFQTLPAEICLLIMENIYSHTTIWRLISASPAMLRCHQQHKTKLLRTYISKLTQAGDDDKGLLEDAIGIMGFNNARGNNRAIEVHFNRWAANTLPDPFKKLKKNRIAKLDRLFSRVGLFIEDYMSKATSHALALEYLSLPKITYTNTNKRVTLDDLTPTERYRLFRAFLKFELLCKVFDPHVKMAICGETTSLSDEDDELTSSSDDKDKSRRSEHYWNIAQGSWQETDPWLYESIHCVWDYIQTCYGAIFAHVAWADKYPAFLTTDPRRKSLLYPDNMYVRSHEYFKDMRMPRECTFLTIWTACQGLDLLFHFLTHMGKGPEGTRNMRRWIYSIYCHHSTYYRHIRGRFLFKDHPENSTLRHTHIRLPAMLIKEEGSPYSGWNISSPIWSDREQQPDYASIPYDQLKIFRQRAWILCDDTRLYPPVDVHFPDTDTLAEQRQQAWDLGPSENNVSKRRRSPEWQDYWAGRTLESPSIYDEEVDEVELSWRNPVHALSFYDSPHGQGLSTFWRHEKKPRFT